MRARPASNRLAGMVRHAGIGFTYHNHPFEFAGYGGRRGIDILLAGTGPATVKWELGVAWAVSGGDDPVRLLHAHRDRIRTFAKITSNIRVTNL